MTGPTLDEAVRVILANPDREVTFRVEVNGEPYSLRKWRDGTIALRPVKSMTGLRSS